MNVFKQIKNKWQEYKERRDLKYEAERTLYKGVFNLKPGSKEMAIQSKAIDNVRGNGINKSTWIQVVATVAGTVLVAIIKELALGRRQGKAYLFETTEYMVGSEPGKAAVKDALTNRH